MTNPRKLGQVIVVVVVVVVAIVEPAVLVRRMSRAPVLVAARADKGALEDPELVGHVQVVVVVAVVVRHGVGCRELPLSSQSSQPKRHR